MKTDQINFAWIFLILNLVLNSDCKIGGGRMRIEERKFPLGIQQNIRRSRHHIERILKYNEHTSNNVVVKKLCDIYKEDIKPLEDKFHYNDLDDGNDMSIEEIKSEPMVLLLGPWSSGKTSLINYLLDTNNLLRVGAEPTTSEFTIISYGKKLKKSDGKVLVADRSKQFAPLDKFGRSFLERLTNVEFPHPLLKKITFVDTPGVVENRKQSTRGYDYNKVMRWFIQRSQLIIIVFDPSKLDVGHEFETLFKQLRGKESKIRLILNKADSIEPSDLMKVYGTLYWSLGPLLNVTEPPRIYMGSFWSNEFKPTPNTSMFKHEENCLLKDLRTLIENDIENRIGSVREHAVRVRIHAMIINEYLDRFYTEWSLFTSELVAASNVIHHPHHYNIFTNVCRRLHISYQQLPSAQIYKELFNLHPITSFTSLAQQCTFFRGCPIKQLDNAIMTSLPLLLTTSLQQHHDDVTNRKDEM